MSARLMFVVNVDWFFVSHRLPIALQALRQGYEVHIACGMTDWQSELERAGLVVHPLPIERGKAGLVSNIRTFLATHALFRRVQPDIVHLVTIKPVLFGGIAARLADVRGVVAAISGLGFVFLDAGLKAFVRRAAVAFLYRLALGKKNLKVIFQNQEDRESLCRLAGIPESKTVLIRGSGVDLSCYSFSPLPEGLPIVILAARLLKDKGVMEFVEAAAMLKATGCQARFCLVGEIDPDNPASLTASELASLCGDGKIEFWGQRKDMPEVMRTAYVVVLPSYREGLPKVLLEAAACGRAVVTTDVPGCRDAIDPGVSGLLVPVRDAPALADAIGSLLDDPRRCAAMGKAGRALAEREFDVAAVVRRHLEIYRELEAAA